MTVVSLTLRPLESGAALPGLADATPLSADEALDLYRATAADVARAVLRSSATLLVHYAPAADYGDDVDAEARAREVLTDVDGAEEARYEPQVGSTLSARVGNAVTHLLDAQEEFAVLHVTGTTPLLARTQIDSAATRLRSEDVALAPDADGGVALAAFREPVDFTGVLDAPALPSLARRGVEADLDVGFLPTSPTVASPTGLRAVLAETVARRAAGRITPIHTAAAIDDLDLAIDGDAVVRSATDSS